jgi:hypothetical protein
MKYGNRATLSKVSRKTVDVEIPEADQVFRLRELSGTERDKFEVAVFKEDKDGKRTVEPLHLKARLVALCWVDPDNNNARVYADDEVHQLNDDWPSSIVGKLFLAAQHLNGLDAAAVEEATKNFASAPADASSSDLH